MDEQWQDIKGYEDLYQISNLGNARTKKRVITYSTGARHNYDSVIKNQRIKYDGYHRVTLSKESVKKTFSVHRLVAEHHIKRVEGKNEVNHKSGDKTDNSVYNLEWVTNTENMKHAHQNGFIKYSNGEKHMWSKLKEHEVFEILDFVKNTNMLQREIAALYGVSHSVVSRIKSGARWGITTGGVCHRH